MNTAKRPQWWRPPAGNGAESGSAQSGVPAPGTSGSALPFRALLAFTFILLLAPQAMFPVLAPLRIALLAAALAVAAYVLDCFARRRPVVRFAPEMRIALCLLAWAVATVPFSYWAGGSVSFLIEVYIKILIVFWLLGHVVDSVPRLCTVAWALSLMAVPLALSGIENFLSGNFVREGVPLDQARIVGYDAGLTANPNDLALMLNLILPLSVALLLANRHPFVRAVLLALIGLDVIGIIITFSRAGFLTLAVTFASYLWLLRRRPERGWAWLVVVVALAAAPFLPASYLDRLATITSVEADPTGSSQARWRDTVAAVGYVVEHPLVGAGVGMNALALNEARGEKWTEIHNVYLQYAVDLGIPGLILFLLLLRACLNSARQARQRASPAGDLFWLAQGIHVSLIALAVAALFHPAAYHFYFYYMAGLAVAARAIAEPYEASPARARVSAPPALAQGWKAQ